MTARVLELGREVSERLDRVDELLRGEPNPMAVGEALCEFGAALTGLMAESFIQIHEEHQRLEAKVDAIILALKRHGVGAWAGLA